ncbi:MAG: hypothetical protein HN341_10310 [Verrucomicrobia bacterium]|jgi:hypothetical protein|nr:hypothetical protein [Verrucomicrobiota bacterium]
MLAITHRPFVAVFLGLMLFVSGLSQAAPASLQSVEATKGGIVLSFEPATLAHQVLSTSAGSFATLSAGESIPQHAIGLPALPTYRHLFGMPEGTEPRVEVLGYDTEDVLLADLGIDLPVMPAQPSLSKSASSADVVFEWDQAAYAQDAFNTTELASVAKSGTMRGVGIGALVVSPFRYNPVTGVIRIYKNLRIQVHFDAAKSAQAKTTGNTFSPFFTGALKSLIHLPETVTAKADLTRIPVTYLIVASDALSGNAKLAQFIRAKRRVGFNVRVKYVASTASPATIDAWIESKYATISPKPTFVLIVGDESGSYRVQTDVNPALGSGSTFTVSRSDLRYGVIGPVGAANRIPSMYVGRFSVRSLADLNAQVDKTIWYETGQFAAAVPNLSYLLKPLGAAGNDSYNATPYGNPHIAYEFNHYLNTAHGMPSAVHYLHPTAATMDATIRSHVSGGVNFYNYTAHGWEFGFADPSFTIANVDALGNSGRYPLVIGNCCLTGSFGSSECFGEAWLNAPNKGAIGFIGASMSTAWNEDLVMGVGTISAYNNPSPPLSQASPGMIDGVMMGNYPTQAALKHAGLLAVENYGGSLVNHYWLSYHLFGDPSLAVHFGIPTVQAAAHASSVAAGATTFQVTTTPGAYVALIDDSNVLHGAAVANGSGIANLVITPFVSGNAKLAVTAQFRRPLFKTLPVSGGVVSPVQVSAFAINNGNATTSGRTVTLNNTCSGSPILYVASEQSNFRGAKWRAYSTAPSFVLSSGAGVKRVYFKAKSATGVSPVVSDTIQITAPAPGKCKLVAPGGTVPKGWNDFVWNRDPERRATLYRLFVQANGGTPKTYNVPDRGTARVTRQVFLAGNTSYTWWVRGRSAAGVWGEPSNRSSFTTGSYGPIHTLVVSGSSVRMAVWDNGSLEDGDRVRIMVNGVIRRNVNLTFAKQYVTLPLRYGNNIITITAINEGTASPNSGAATFSGNIHSGNGTYSWNINKGQSVTIKAVRK